MHGIVPSPRRAGKVNQRARGHSVDAGAPALGCGYDGPRHCRGGFAPMDGFLALYVFMLAAFTGYEIIGRVPVILHTPLMSGSNFVHGIVLVGAMVVLGEADTTTAKAIGFIAVLLGAGNAAGGYVVTERMLEMFKSSKKEAAK
jgi:NAD(P) transhydrogenase subunit alpha